MQPSANPTDSKEAAAATAAFRVLDATADTQGAVLGNKVAQYLKKHYFQPVR